jgi:cellulose synthase/poly-beta-1,6-N-acetylglucosamine synthase-like glycosyltransferase
MQWLPAILILPYFILLLKLFSSLPQIKSFKLSSDPSIFISLIIAYRNEEQNLATLLNDLTLQNYPKHLFEVILVDDGSSDNSSEITNSFHAIENLTILFNSGKGKKQALRTGIASAKGDLIITTDADCRIGNDWIRSITSYYVRYKPDMIICPVKLETTNTFAGRLQELEFLSLQGITAATAIAGNATMCNGANLAFTRKGYLDHAGDLHDEINSGDDMFLLHSLKQDKGSKILWMESAEATITTKGATSIVSFLKQRSRWIAKSNAYTDRDTIFLGIITFTAIITELACLTGTILKPSLLIVFLLVLILKSIPDFLILENTIRRYGKSKLMWWFLPALLLYPFYVLSVVIYTMLYRNK